MGYKITFKQSVWKDLKRLDKADATRILEKIEHELAEQANQYPILTGKFSGLRKYRLGKYRIIYTLQEETVLILRIGHRSDVNR